MDEQLRAMGFVPSLPEAFLAGEGLDDVHTVVSLSQRSCTDRAAQLFCQAHATLGRELHIRHVFSFQHSVDAVHNDVHAVMLIPQLHPLQRSLERQSAIVSIPAQHFSLPNPGLHLATPLDFHSDRTYLSLPALVPLVREQYVDQLPFEEIVPANSTQDAAFQCSRIFGGAFCVTNDEGLKAFRLRSERVLRHIVMNWFMYRKNRKGMRRV